MRNKQYLNVAPAPQRQATHKPPVDTSGVQGRGKQDRKVHANKQKHVKLLDLCVSSLRRGNANLLCVVQILTDVPRRESVLVEWRRCEQESGVEPKACGNGAPSCAAALAECGRHAPSERTPPPAPATHVLYTNVAPCARTRASPLGQAGKMWGKKATDA